MQAITKEHENFKDDSIQSNNGLFYVIFEISGIFAERCQDNDTTHNLVSNGTQAEPGNVRISDKESAYKRL